MTKRNKLEVMKDILSIIQEHRAIKTTPLLRKSGLSSSSFKEYYNLLVNKEFIINADKKVKLSEKGFRFLEKYKTIMGFIEEFEL